MDDHTTAKDTTSAKTFELHETSAARTSSQDIEGKIIDLDERRLRAQGHEAQLDRSFTWLGASALAYRWCHPCLAAFLPNKFG